MFHDFLLEAGATQTFCVHAACTWLTGSVSTHFAQKLLVDQDPAETLVSAELGHQFTPYLKIKLNANIEHARVTLDLLDQQQYRQQHCQHKHAGSWQLPKTWSVDANAAWSPEISMAFLQLLTEYHERIYMVEQPFPVDISSCTDAAVLGAWADVRRAYNEAGMLVYADESVHTEADVMALRSIADGVNVKMEKAGGIRAAVRTLQAAKHAGMLTWVGCMVGGTHNSSTTASLLQLADHGDLDGALLVTEASDLFAGGFTWGRGDAVGHILLSDRPGVGTWLKQSSDSLSLGSLT